MRRPVAEYRQNFHRHTPPKRLTSMIVMCMLLVMLVYSVRDPAKWQWLVQAQNAAHGGAGHDDPPPAAALQPAVQPAAQPAKVPEVAEKPAQAEAGAEKSAALAPTGPTDEDEEEKDSIREARDAIFDGGEYIRGPETVAYNHLLTWVNSQPLALLRKRATRDPALDQFFSQPNDVRFRIFELTIDVRRVIKIEDVKGPQGQQLYEIHGLNRRTGAMVYFGIVQDLPPGTPVGPEIQAFGAKLVGYFFKLQGYQSVAELGKKGRTLRGPMFIGRLGWLSAPTVAVEPTPLWVLVTSGLIVSIVTVVGVVFAARASKRNALPAPLAARLAGPAGPEVDQWLNQAQSGETAVDVIPEGAMGDGGEGGDPLLRGVLFGNNFPSENDSKNGHGSEDH